MLLHDSLGFVRSLGFAYWVPNSLLIPNELFWLLVGPGQVPAESPRVLTGPGFPFGVLFGIPFGFPFDFPIWYLFRLSILAFLFGFPIWLSFSVFLGFHFGSPFGFPFGFPFWYPFGFPV